MHCVQPRVNAGVCAASDLVAGARFEADSDRAPLVTAHWLYAGVKQGTREMVRVGLAEGSGR